MVSTFYLSRVIGNKVFFEDIKLSYKLLDLVVDVSMSRPMVIAARVKVGREIRLIDYSHFSVVKEKGQYSLKCSSIKDYKVKQDDTLFLVKHIMDKQIVDMDGRKLVRVNDLRLAALSSGTYVVAVDVGVEGLLRRLGVAKPIKKALKPFARSIPSKLILWDEVETINFSNMGIKLSKTHSKLSTMHPSDVADIIEDLDRNTQIQVFSSLDEEQAADVLEELETDAQINLLESLSVEKAADVLEKMPADEVADILDELEDERAEELLSEMESEASEEVRELMEYPENSVGSLMTTDYISFNENTTVNEVILELRKQKPDSDTIYYLYILDDKERLVATASLRDIIVSEPETRLKEIMNKNVIFVYDDDKINSLTEIISKYSLLALPVVDENMVMVGIVIINDIVYTLLKTRKRRV